MYVHHVQCTIFPLGLEKGLYFDHWMIYHAIFNYTNQLSDLHLLTNKDPNAFKDPEFLQDMSSIGSSSTSFHIEPPEMWLPARRLGDPTEAVLFDQVKPQDIRQGSSIST